MKRLFGLLVGALLLAGVLSGCTIEDELSFTTLTVGVPYNGSINAFGIRFFTFTATTTTHSATLSNLGSDFSWALCNNSSCGYLSEYVYCDTSATNGNETCSMSAFMSIGSKYYLRVDEWDSVAGSYTFVVNP